MIWLIILTIFWIVGCIFYFSICTVAKRADEMAETMFTNEISQNAVSTFLNDDAQRFEKGNEVIGQVCLT
ncbi:hypothetical protein [Paenibacillus sp. WC2504]|uniref:hypothetical protein n=1 Tax=Paenibacillus sp. WC2504 TaxID=3461403 RepID=UPI0040467958